jgi:hypothetical protein
MQKTERSRWREPAIIAAVKAFNTRPHLNSTPALEKAEVIPLAVPAQSERREFQSRGIVL